jgi:hypothetical protein
MPLKLEHQELHANLVKATKAGGRVGDAAKAVAKVLHVHFVKEEQVTLPPLGFYPPWPGTKSHEVLKRSFL